MGNKSKHHTKNPVRRAADIANREAKKACQEAGNCSLCFPTWLKVFEAALKEFGWSETVTE